MSFEDVLDQAIDMLRRRGRLTYRTLQRQFNLDDHAIEDLKDELLFSHPVVDEKGQGLVWTGETPVPIQSPQPETNSEKRYRYPEYRLEWYSSVLSSHGLLANTGQTRIHTDLLGISPPRGGLL